MRANWRVGVLVVLFVLQSAFVFFQDRLFQEAMEIKHEWVQERAVKAGVSEEQARAVSYVMWEVKYEVSSYVRNALGLSLAFNFSMLMVAVGIRQKGEV